jgi:hypothetical protein
MKALSKTSLLQERASTEQSLEEMLVMLLGISCAHGRASVTASGFAVQWVFYLLHIFVSTLTFMPSHRRTHALRIPMNHHHVFRKNPIFTITWRLYVTSIPLACVCIASWMWLGCAVAAVVQMAIDNTPVKFHEINVTLASDTPSPLARNFRGTPRVSSGNLALQISALVDMPKAPLCTLMNRCYNMEKRAANAILSSKHKHVSSQSCASARA